MAQDWRIWKAFKVNTEKSKQSSFDLFTEVPGGNLRFQTNLYVGFEKRECIFMIGGHAYDSLKSLPAGQEEDIEIALASLRMLGFKEKDQPTYGEVVKAISKDEKISFCTTAEEIILPRVWLTIQKKDREVTIPLNDGLICFRLENHSDSMEGKSKLWLLEGACDPDRICKPNEFFIIRILKEPEVEAPVGGNNENQNPTLKV